MTDLSPERVAELERLLVLATEGPYPLHKSERWKIRERATALIAERTALLAERKRLRAENERLREALESVRVWVEREDIDAAHAALDPKGGA